MQVTHPFQTIGILLSLFLFAHAETCMNGTLTPMQCFDSGFGWDSTQACCMEIPPLCANRTSVDCQFGRSCLWKTRCIDRRPSTADAACNATSPGDCDNTAGCEFDVLSNRCVQDRLTACLNASNEGECMGREGCWWIEAECRTAGRSPETVACWTYDGNQASCVNQTNLQCAYDLVTGTCNAANKTFPFGMQYLCHLLPEAPFDSTCTNQTACRTECTKKPNCTTADLSPFGCEPSDASLCALSTDVIQCLILPQCTYLSSMGCVAVDQPSPADLALARRRANAAARGGEAFGIAAFFAVFASLAVAFAVALHTSLPDRVPDLWSALWPETKK